MTIRKFRAGSPENRGTEAQIWPVPCFLGVWQPGVPGKANARTYMVPHPPSDSPIWDGESALWNARSGAGRVNVNSLRLCIVTQRESGSDLGFFVNHHHEPVLLCSRPSH